MRDGHRAERGRHGIVVLVSDRSARGGERSRGVYQSQRARTLVGDPQVRGYDVSGGRGRILEACEDHLRLDRRRHANAAHGIRAGTDGIG
jgi:hypothetical protein